MEAVGIMNQDNLQLIKETYQGKNVFLTGHTGFKGSWLLYWLHILGANIKGYSLAPLSDNDLFVAMRGENLCDSVTADIRDKERLAEEVQDFQPDFIFHLAAQPLVRLSYEIPAETFEINAIGTANVLDAMRGLEKACTGIMITTDKVYENKEWHYPYRENDRLGGYDPYSASKACTELVISSYRNSFFHPEKFAEHQKAIASARAGNVIGGGDWAKDRIIPDIVRALKGGVPITVRNPSAVRPWQHVLEPLGGYLLLGALLAQNPVDYAGAWNFGPLAEDNLDVESLVKIALKSWGSGTYEKPQINGQPHEAGLLKLDISKAVSKLSWYPKWKSEDAIQMTINWYKEFLNGASAPDLAKSDISKLTG